MWSTALTLLLSLSHAWGDQICCNYGGCFNNNAPYSHLPLPDCPSVIKPVFNLFTRNNRNSSQSMTRTSIPLAFSGSRMTVFIVHGYQNTHKQDWMHDIKNALLDRDNVNVVLVGWENGANALFYPKSASNTRAAGAELGLVMENIKSKGGSAASRIYCVGHSLGSHLCGHAGRWTSIGRISGLDPAGPSFDSYSIDASLNSEAATFVDVLHTHGTGGPLVNYGTMRVLGHMDFYPNNGGLQPGCSTSGTQITCSSSRAHQFFRESVKRDCFITRSKCMNNNNIPGSCSDCGSQCAIMGYGAKGSGSNGLYLLSTTASAPYCQN